MILKVFLGLGSAIAGLIAAGLIILLHAGVATVWVESPEAKFFVPVPIAVVDVALQFVPGEDLRDGDFGGDGGTQSLPRRYAGGGPQRR